MFHQIGSPALLTQSVWPQSALQSLATGPALALSPVHNELNAGINPHGNCDSGMRSEAPGVCRVLAVVSSSIQLSQRDVKLLCVRPLS